ncbi:MAG: transketolase [Bacteroidales bacterium]|nr:transketolase [Bacteroidales bacterium]
MPNIIELEKIASQLRRDIVRMVHGASSGHPGGSLGCADVLVALYFEVLNHNPEKFLVNENNGQDLFFLSIGHISAAWYSVLARSGYFDVAELATFRKINSRLQGHPATEEDLPGIRIASGSLGQGLSVAIGAAIAKKLEKDPNIVYCLMGDGEIQEGQVWEAAMYASAKKVDNLIAIVDYNGKQIDGPVEEVMPINNIHGIWKKFGWTVLEMDGNNMTDVVEKLKLAKEYTNNKKAVVIIMNTVMGFGVDFMMGTHKWHGVPPNDEQAEQALSQLEETIGDY